MGFGPVNSLCPGQVTATRDGRARVGRKRDSVGQGLAALILAVAVLGGLAALIPLLTSGTSGHHADQVLAPQVASRPQGAAADIQAAGATTCRVDYQAVQNAVQEYEAMNGRPPASLAELQTVLQGPIASSRFAITINSGHPGEIDVSAPGHPAEAGSGNCAYAG
jgi:hypothetical protein